MKLKLEIKLDETVLEMADDFQYLSAWLNDTMKDFKSHRNIKYEKIKMLQK